MPILMLKSKQIAFPALAEPQAIGDGEPAYGGKLVIDPKDADVKLLDAAMLQAAKEKWKEDGESVFEMLKDEKKVCFVHGPYKSSKTGKPYAGFENKYHLGMRTPTNKPRPSVFDQYGKPLIAEGKFQPGVSKTDVEQTVYSGAVTNCKVEIWAQDNSFGRRINCSVLGVMYAGEGESFGGGSAPASASDFAGMAAQPADAEDCL